MQEGRWWIFQLSPTLPLKSLSVFQYFFDYLPVSSSREYIISRRGRWHYKCLGDRCSPDALLAGLLFFESGRGDRTIEI